LRTGFGPNAGFINANRLQTGDAGQMLSEDTTVFYLESLLRRFIYSEPLRLKTNAKIRSAALTSLDQLVDSGASAAYRMRDDFVTPIAQQNPSGRVGHPYSVLSTRRLR
jgi:hypothetical protein